MILVMYAGELATHSAIAVPTHLTTQERGIVPFYARLQLGSGYPREDLAHSPTSQKRLTCQASFGHKVTLTVTFCVRR
jgi:hypothetical protein